MSSLDLFSEKSDLYALARPTYPQELYNFLESCVDKKNKVWDCATGNGQAAVALSEIFGEVQATDLSEQQIAHAVRKDNIHYSVQSAEHTNFQDNYFDLITVAQAIHWFDYEKFWPEVKRVLKPGGVFAAWGYDWCRIRADIDEVISDYILKVIEPFWATQNQLVWNGYKDIDFPFRKIPAPKIEMNQYWNLTQLLNYMSTWSATRLCIKSIGPEFFEIATDRIKSVWGDIEMVKEVKMDVHIYVGRN